MYGEWKTISPEFSGIFIHKTPAISQLGWQCFTFNEFGGLILTQVWHLTSTPFLNDGIFDITSISRSCRTSPPLTLNVRDWKPPRLDAVLPLSELSLKLYA